MRAQTGAVSLTEARATKSTRPADGLGFDWLMAAVSGWLVGGMWLDAWAHHNVPATLETFFTPWHAVLYSGLLATNVVLLLALFRNRVAGAPWRAALPAGYGWSLAGALVFAVGGAADMVWHLLFGIEADLEALLSPSHLLLAVGGALLVSGPLRAAWQRPAAEPGGGWGALLPGLLSLTFVLSLLMFFTEYTNPFSTPWPAGWAAIAPLSETFGQEELPRSPRVDMLGQALGVAGILLYSALLMGSVLLALRWWRPPFGALTIITILALGLAVVPHGQYRFVPVALLAGLAADGLRAWLRPSSERPAAVRLFAFSVPATLFALYFLALALTGGVTWTIHLWTGAIMLAGVVGLLLSYLAAPPPAARAGKPIVPPA